MMQSIIKRTIRYNVSKRLFSNEGHQYLFDHDTAIKKIGISNNDSSCTKFRAKITDNFSIGDAPNGGYLMCIAISAARECIPFRDPFSITGHYVNKSIEFVDADVIVQVLNQAKSSATVEISLIQQDKLRAKYIATFGDFKKMRHFFQVILLYVSII